MYKLNELMDIELANDECVLVDLLNGKMYKLTNSAYLLLQSIKDTEDIEKYVMESLKKYPEVREDKVRNDAKKYAVGLLEKSIIEKSL